MIKVKITEGLGNQMFQYAFARAIELEYNKEVWLEVSWFPVMAKQRTWTVRPFELDKYSALLRCMPDGDTSRCSNHVKETDLMDIDVVEYIGTHKTELVATDDVFFDGHWQSPAYFKKYASIIRDELQLKGAYITDDMKLFEDRVLNEESVSIHIRRTDYHNSPSLCIQPIGYYVEAVKYVMERVKDARMYVFTDDPAWVEHNMRDKLPCRYTVMEKAASYEDLYRISKTKHHIIANSTFSWWGAFMNDGEGLTVAPSIWWNNKSAKDIYMDKWVVI